MKTAVLNNINQRLPADGTVAVEIITEDNVNKIANDSILVKSDDVTLLEKICDGGGRFRKLQTLGSTYEEVLDRMLEDFPNFEEVIEYLRGEFIKTYLLKNKEVSWVTPILLLGVPGVGKTEFARSMCELFDLKKFMCDFSISQASFGLSGIDRGYADASTGEVFKNLMEGEYANPVFFIDEVDKTDRDERYSPIKILYSLLEKKSAAQFVDTYIKSPIDASHINWIFTANDMQEFPAALQSRMKTFEIDEPDEIQSRRIAQNIFNSICMNYEKYPKSQLSDEVLDVLVQQGPRSTKQILNTAIGKAAKAGRTEILTCDLEVAVKPQKKRTIGFINT